MLIRCPQCGTGFNLPAEKIPANGAKVKCSACTHTFRVRLEGGEPVFFYKKGEAPRTGETMIGAPIDVESLKPTAKTQFGVPQRSKSSAGDYNPFPLAGTVTGEQAAVTKERARNDRTQLLGSGSEAEEELDDADLILDEDDYAEDHTLLAAAGLSASKDPPPLRTLEEELGRTKAFGSGGLDLFDDDPAPAPSEPPPIDIDPFGDAFDEPIGDVGLLMPSTPRSDDPAPTRSAPDPTASTPGMTEADFLLGGGASDFGDALSLVDNSFGADGPSFDPHSGVVDTSFTTSKRPRTGEQRSLRTDAALELDHGHPDPPRRRANLDPEPAATRSAERARPAPRPAPAYVHQVGATSAVRRTFDVLFITLVVAVAFVGLIAARAGGFVDFTRFGHMVEVAFGGAEFQPREGWQKIVEIAPPDPPPDEPLRLHDVRAIEKKLDDRTVLVVAGRIRNYSLQEFTGVEVLVTVTNGEEKLVERKVKVGQLLDRKKLGKAKSIDAVKASLQAKLADVGKEGKTYFAIVLDDVPSAVVEAGTYDYTVEVVD